AAVRDPGANGPAGREVAEARAILATNAAYVPALMLCAAAREKQGQFSDAAQLCETVLGRYPLFSPAVRAWALITFDHLREDQKAYSLAVKARESFPADADVRRMLGTLAYRRGD